jgi:hypothetical protein
MLSRHKAKEMKRRASQRKATHKARLLALTLRSETRMAAATPKAEKGKTKVGSKGSQINSESKQAEEGIACMGKVA